MAIAKDCFETGLFLMGTVWGDRNTKPQQHLIATKQATFALKNLDIDTKFVDKSTPPTSVSHNVKAQLLWVANTVDFLQKELKPLIEKLYGTEASYCYQAGIDLGNLMFVSGILDSSVMTPAQFNNLKFLHPYLDNLKLSSTGIGNPPMLEEFIKDYANILSSPSNISALLGVPAKATTCAQQLAVWIDINIHLGKQEGILQKSVPGFLEGIPYLGKGLAELYKNWKGRKGK